MQTTSNIDMGVLRLLVCLVTCLVPGNTQNPGVPHYLSSTFFGNANRIAVPKIPNSISEPALNAQAYLPFQGSLSQPQSPVRRPFGAPFPNVGGAATLGLQQQIVQFSPGQINSNAGGSLGASFANLGQSASLGIQQQPIPVQSSPAQVSPPRLGKAVESGPGPKFQSTSPGRASFNQFGPGPEGPQSSLQDSLGKALDQASKSSQFSFPPNKSPVLKEGGANFGPQGIKKQGPVPGFPQRQQSNLERKPSSPIPSTFNHLGDTFSPGPVSQRQSSSPVLDSFNQFRSVSGESQSSLQESLGQALDKASKSASFSLPTKASPGPAQGGTNFRSPSLTRQGPGFSQGSQSGFHQRLGSLSSQGSSSTGSGFSVTPQLDLEQALTKASEEAAGQTGPRNGAQLSNNGPVIPAVPSLLEEINLGDRSPGSFVSSGSDIFRGNSASRSSPLIRTQSNGSPSRAQSGQPLVFDATPSGNVFDRQPFRSDPKISGQRIQQSGSPPSSKIFLGSTRLSDSPRSSSLSSGIKVSTPRKTCTKTFTEECRNEYKMVCEETFTEREKYECKIVEDTKCEQGHTIEYEPACFQQILENCENICKRGIQPNCMPQCARSLGKTSCHKVKVVTPHTTCIKVPKEVCGNVKKRIPYEKCHDVPKKVCKQVPQEVCK